MNNITVIVVVVEIYVECDLRSRHLYLSNAEIKKSSTGCPKKMLHSDRLACTRLRPKFNKSPLDIMMGMIVFVLFGSASGSEGLTKKIEEKRKQWATAIQPHKTSCFGFIQTNILVLSALLQKIPTQPLVIHVDCGRANYTIRSAFLLRKEIFKYG